MKKKILIVEDEKLLGEMCRDALESVGFEVILAYGYFEGLEALKKEKPDLILLDILLPEGKTGVEFLEEMKKDPKISEIPVIAFSNYDFPETREKALKLGVKEYLLKTSYIPKEIIKKVKKYLG